MLGLIGTAIGISIMARVATGVCRAMERPYGSYPRRNYNDSYNSYKRRYNNYNYRNKNTHQQPQQPNTHQQQLPLQQPQQQPQPRQKPRYNSYSYKPGYSYKPKPVHNKNGKQPYWKLKVI